jgi:hypothetical protein
VASKFRYILYALLLIFLWFGFQSSSYLSAEPITTTNSRFDHLAIALKSGKDVALHRVPIQLLTFLKPVKNKLIIGDANQTIGSFDMLDVISDQERLGKRSQTEIKPNESSPGWTNDAKKNIHGFDVLYHHFPQAEWFIMIDDDTYLFMENLRWFLKKYNPNKAYYFGVATLFQGCDGVTKLGDGPFFAHGGSGIVLSRAALLKMREIKGKCLEKYSTCWAGDIRVALCLRDAGIFLLHSSRFHGKPPNDQVDYQHPCQRPISFHHLLPSQTQQLHELTKNGKKRLADMAHHFLSDDLLVGFDRPHRLYKPYKTMELESVDLCKKRCRLENRCLSYSYSDGTCYFRDGIHAAQQNSTFTSGVMLEHYYCYPWQLWHHS